MTLHFEVIGRFQAAADANHLLYTPIADVLTSRHTRVYAAECEGDLDAARAYLLRVLVDPIAQTVAEDGKAQFSSPLFIIDYGMKAGALDLEKEAILENYQGQGNLGFTLKSLKITQRIYVFGEGDKDSLSKRFAKDVCNPAIHNWSIA